jgi:hypothetical protein
VDVLGHAASVLLIFVLLAARDQITLDDLGDATSMSEENQGHPMPDPLTRIPS